MPIRQRLGDADACLELLQGKKTESALGERQEKR